MVPHTPVHQGMFHNCQLQTVPIRIHSVVQRLAAGSLGLCQTQFVVPQPLGMTVPLRGLERATVVQTPQESFQVIVPVQAVSLLWEYMSLLGPTVPVPLTVP